MRTPRVQPVKDKIVQVDDIEIRRRTAQTDAAAVIRSDAVPEITSKEAMTALKKMNRQSAVCIDGWGPTLLLQAIMTDTSLLEDIRMLMSIIQRNEIGERAQRVLNLGRVVAIPSGSKIRPITVSNFFLKFLGAIVMQQVKPTCSDHQYAIAFRNGTQTIAHAVRKAYDEGQAIIKIDLSNAFHEAKRSLVREAIEGDDIRVRKYFELTYGSSFNELVFFKSGGYELIPFQEGVRQGGPMSSYLFCKLIDKVIKDTIIGCMYNYHTHPQILAYMDDITIVTDKALAEPIALELVKAVENNCLRANITKSAIHAKSNWTGALLNGLIKYDDDYQFILMGALISTRAAAYVKEKSAKTRNFIAKLNEISIHPQLKYTLMRISGFSRVKYFTEVNHPTVSALIADVLIQGVRQIAATMIQTSQVITDDMIFNTNKLGCPNYKADAMALYTSSQNEAIKTASWRQMKAAGEATSWAMRPAYLPAATPTVPTPAAAIMKTTPPISVDESAAHTMPSDAPKDPNAEDSETASDAESSVHSSDTETQSEGRSKRKRKKYNGETRKELTEFLFWKQGSISPSDFIIAMAIRLGVVPDRLRCTATFCNCGKRLLSDEAVHAHLTDCPSASQQEMLHTSVTCACGERMNEDIEVSNHVMKCDKSSSISHTTRHNRIRDTFCQVVQRFGYPVSREPTCYKEFYTSTHERPDIIFHLPKTNLVTDVKITKVQSFTDAEKEKRKIHEAAVKNLHHTFIPAIFSPDGGMSKGTIKIINVIKQSLPAYMKNYFELEMRRMLACSLAISRAEAWRNFVTQQNLSGR